MVSERCAKQGTGIDNGTCYFLVNLIPLIHMLEIVWLGRLPL